MFSEEEPAVYDTGEPGWIELSAKRVFSNMVPPAKAKRDVKDMLRNGAIQKKSPTAVEISSLLTDVITDESEQTAWSGFFRTTLTGMITDEEVVKENIAWLEPGGYEVDMTLRAYVVPVQGKRDPSLAIDVLLEKDLLKSGDELLLRVKCTRDVYLYVFSLMADNNIMMIFPNEFMRTNRLDSGTWMVIPSERERKMGIHFRVAPTQNEDITAEGVYVVGTKQPVAGLDNLPKVSEELPVIDAGSKSFLEFQSWLTNIPLDQRIEKVVVYHVGR